MFGYTFSDDSLNVKSQFDVNDAIEFSFSFSSMSIDSLEINNFNIEYGITSNSSENTSGRDSVGNASIINVHHLEVHYNQKSSRGLTKNECPATICIANSIGGVRSRRLLKVLLDSGSSQCLIKRSALPKGIVPKELAETKSLKTLAGPVKSTQVVTIQEMRLPEFNKDRKITQQKSLVFDNPNITYDIILGTNYLSKTGIKLNYERGQMEWFDGIISMRPTKSLKTEDFHAMKEQWHVQVEESPLGEDWLEC